MDRGLLVGAADETSRWRGRIATVSDRHTRFREVYDRDFRPVSAYVLRRASPREDAADVIAEVFLVAWRRLDEVPAGRSSLPWLYGVARKQLANHRRSETRRLRLASRLGAELERTKRFATTDDGLPEGFAEAFSTLREADREILSLAAWEQLDATAIATVIACSPNAARIRLHRARKRLAQELGAGQAKYRDPIGHGSDVERAALRRTDD